MIEMSTEFFWGKEIAEKEKQFKDELEKVKAKHIDYFRSKPAKSVHQDHERLMNHYFILTDTPGRVTFKFLDTDLPDEIRKDCIEAFKLVYPGSTDI